MITIYKITNKINNKIYIGQSINYEKRINEHISGRKKEDLHRQQVIDYAIKKYGKENFTFEKILECKTQQEADEKERFYISLYESTKRDKGYNILRGGRNQNGSWNSKEIAVYNLNGDYIESCESAREYERIHPDYNAISINECCRLKKRKYKEKIFRLLGDEKPKPYIKPKSTKMKKVNQFTLDGKFINSFNSLENASKQTKISRTSISGCVIGKNRTAGGYLWSYSDSVKGITKHSLLNKGYEIYKIDIESEEIIDVYSTTVEAVLDMGLEKNKYKQLCKYIKENKNFNGYKWKRVKKKPCQD